MESRQQSHNRYIGKLEKHIELTKENTRYSSDRFDILIISLSTSALVFSIGFIKDIVIDFSSLDTSCLKTSWLLFVIALISNLISQVSGYFSNFYDIKVTASMIREERGNPKDDDEVRNDQMHKYFNYITHFLNLASLMNFIIGVIILISFISNNI